MTDRVAIKISQMGNIVMFVINAPAVSMATMTTRIDNVVFPEPFNTSFVGVSCCLDSSNLGGMNGNIDIVARQRDGSILDLEAPLDNSATQGMEIGLANVDALAVSFGYHVVIIAKVNKR